MPLLSCETAWQTGIGGKVKGKTRLFIIFCIAALLLYWRRLLPDGKEAVEIDLDTERAAQLAARLRAAAAAGRLVGATKQLPGTSAPGRVWYIPVSSADTYRRTHRPRLR